MSTRMHEYAAQSLAFDMQQHVSAMLREPGRYMSPAEREWWRRLLGNLEKAQHDNPHLSSRRGEGTHNG